MQAKKCSEVGTEALTPGSQCASGTLHLQVVTVETPLSDILDLNLKTHKLCGFELRLPPIEVSETFARISTTVVPYSLKTSTVTSNPENTPGAHNTTEAVCAANLQSWTNPLPVPASRKMPQNRLQSTAGFVQKAEGYTAFPGRNPSLAS